QDSTDWKSVFQNFGFFVPRQFAGHPELQTDTPVGLVSKRMGVFGLVRFNGMLVNCAGCHVGMGYNSKGEPDFTGWVGMPNTSIDLEAYSRATYIGLHMALEDKETTKNIIKEIFPDFSDWTIHRLVLFRQTQRRLSKLDKKIGRALPFWAGGPGLTNGVASLKLVTGIIDTKKF